MLNQAIELHDSKIAGLSYEENGRAVLIFSSLYVHESLGRPGIDQGIGWFQSAAMAIENASTTDHSLACPWNVFDGEVEIDGTEYKNSFPLPIGCKKSFKLTLDAIDDDNEQLRIEISGNSVQLTFLGMPGRQETFPGADGPTASSWWT